jgi:hypothetical protein
VAFAAEIPCSSQSVGCVGRRILKQDDHLMDATRYLVMSGRDRMRAKPPDKPKQELRYWFPGSQSQSWMQWQGFHGPVVALFWQR